MPAPLQPRSDTDGVFGGGVLTHGGSLANLTALNAARRAVQPDVWEQGDRGDLAVMVSDSNHYSIERSGMYQECAGAQVLSLELRRRILAAEDFYITSTQFRGKRYLRVVFMNPETSVEDFRRLMTQIRQLIA